MKYPSRHWLVAGITAGSLLTVGPVLADVAPAASEPALDEIIVTAQKRSERLSDVPLSISAETGDQLNKQGITSPTDLARMVPGFSYQKSSFGVPVFTIRGVGVYDTFIGQSPAVTVYVDQAPLPYLAMTQGAALDLERVEVLKGPQGTLFGQNSTGGAINYIAAKPTKDFHAGGDLTYGRFNEIDVEAFVSGPLTDTLTARLAVRRESRGDWQISQSHAGDTLGRRDFKEARLLLDWVPVETVHVELNLNGWQDKSDTQAMQFQEYAGSRPLNGNPPGYPESFIAFGNRPPAPHDPRTADWDDPSYRPLRHDDRFFEAVLHTDVNLTDSMTLTSITAYSGYTAFDTTDADGTDFDNFLETLDAAIHSFSQELRLAGTLGSRTSYTVGGNYQHDIVNDVDLAHYTGSNSGVGPFRYSAFGNRADQTIGTTGAFGALDFKLNETLTAQASARYTKQNRDFQGCLADGGDGALAASLSFFREVVLGMESQPAANGACVTMDANFSTVPVVAESLDQSNVSWRTGLDWKPTEETLLYANVTKGFKAGSFTPLPALFAGQLTPVTQESVLAYEAGIKANPIRSLQLTAAVFYDDYRNKQILGNQTFPLFGALPALQNIPKVSIKGAEFEVLAQPIVGLRLSAGAEYIDSRVNTDFNSEDPLGNVVDVKGEAAPDTPKWQFIADSEYAHPVGNGLSAFVGGNISDRTASNAAFGNNSLFEIHGYSLLDLRTGIESQDGKWRVQVWGHNVLNRYYLLNVSHFVDSVAASTGMPATFGISARFRF